MSTLKTTTTADLTALGATSNTGDTYFDTTAKKIVVWDGSAWTLYNNDGVVAPYSNTYSMEFDGTNDHLALANTVSFTGEFTISLWVKALSGLEGMFFVNSTNGYITWYGPTYGNKVLVRNIGTITAAGNTMYANTWYHLLYVRNSSNATTLYLDGNSVGTSTYSSTLEVSKIWQSNTNGLNGRIDEVALWGSDQSANISDIRDATLSAPKNLADMTTQPTHWWRMGDYGSDYNGGSGTTISDQGTGTSSTATLTNGASFSTDIPS